MNMTREIFAFIKPIMENMKDRRIDRSGRSEVSLPIRINLKCQGSYLTFYRMRVSTVRCWTPPHFLWSASGQSSGTRERLFLSSKKLFMISSTLI